MNLWKKLFGEKSEEENKPQTYGDLIKRAENTEDLGLNLGRIKKIPEDFPWEDGFLVEKSNCCDALLKYTKGGVISPYCSKCGRTYTEQTC